MGGPRKIRKKYETPREPWDPSLVERELRLIGEYGLKNRKELRSLEAVLRKIRNVARNTFSLRGEEREEQTEELLTRLIGEGLLDETDHVEDALRLSARDLLERRLQTVVYRKGLAKSPYQARQFVVHGHIAIGDRVVTKPGKLLADEEIEEVRIDPHSPLSESDHPVWEEEA